MKWQPIKEYDGLYLISDSGIVFSARTGKQIQPQINKKGYVRVELNLNGIEKKYYVHRLVAEAFIPNPDNLPCVNHKDENPRNNNADNLEWCTHEYNSNYGTCIERRVANTEYKNGGHHPQAKRVYRYGLDGQLLAEYGSVADASEETGFNRKSIAKACSGGLKKYMDCVWSYEPTFHYDEHKHYENRSGTVYRYDTKGNLIKEYNSPDEMRADGLDPKNVNRCCRGERKTYLGDIFTRSRYDS